METMNASRLWELNNPERSREIQRKSSQRYYYKNREKVLAKKQQKYAEERGQVIVRIADVNANPPTPSINPPSAVSAPVSPPEPKPAVPEPVKILDPPKPSFSHPLFA